MFRLSSGLRAGAPAALALSCCACLSGQVITTTIGTDWVFPAQPMQAVRAPLGRVTGVALDPRGTGDIYISDASNNMVMRVTPAGVLTVVAGNGQPSPAQGNRDSPPGPLYSGDGGRATNASLSAPGGLAVDRSGNIYIADTSNDRIRKVSPNGIITTIASSKQPTGVAVDDAGNIFIAQKGTGSIVKVSPGGKVIGGAGITNVGEGPDCIAVDANGNAYSYAPNTGHIVRLRPNGTIDYFQVPDGVVIRNGPVGTNDAISGIAADTSGNLYLTADGGIYGDNRILKAILHSPVLSLSVVAGQGPPGFSGDGGPATAASFDTPCGLAVDSAGNIYVADSFNQRVRKVNAANGTVTNFAGNGSYRFSGDGGPAASAALNSPQGLTLDAAGNMYIADTGNHRVRKVTPAGVITTVAGAGTPGFSGDGGPAVNALLKSPVAVAVDSAGAIYIADYGNYRVRKVSGGTITTVAGNTTNSCLSATTGRPPFDISLDSNGSLYIAAGQLCKLSGGVETTFNAGGLSLAVDAAGTVYTSDGRTAIYKFAGNKNTIIAGGGPSGFGGDAGPATRAMLNQPGRMTLDAAGNLYLIDYNNNRIRKIDAAGIITSVAGGLFGQPGGDGGAALSATLQYPQGIAMSRTGDLYLADTGNHRIRVVLAKSPAAQVSPPGLSFRAASGGGATPPQRITIQSDIPAMAYTAAVSTQEGNWLSVQPGAGFAPATLVVTADPTALDPGFHSGVITITLPFANPQTFSVTVSMNVSQSLPPKLSVESPRLDLLTTQSSATVGGVIRAGNAGGGILSFVAAVSTDSGDKWLTVSPSGGNATPVRPVPLTVSANPAGLAPGVYRGAVALAGTDTAEQTTVPVTLVVSPTQGPVLLSQTGMTFQTAAGGGAPFAQNLSILNRGPAPLSWTASARPDWLKLSDTSGSLARPMLDVSTLAVSADPTGLAPGTYYGQISVTANGSGAAAQTVTVMLLVSSTAAANPQIQPAGLIFTGGQGDAPGSQNLVVRNPNVAQLLFNSARLTLDGTDWLQYIPQKANVTAAQPQRVVVQPGFATLSPGVHDGAITFLFADGSISVVRVSSVVAGAGCTPTRLVMLPTNLPQVFTAALNLPATIEVQIVDDCGSPLTADRTGAAVTAAFSNGDRAIGLIPTGNGFWTNTWQPVNSSIGPAYITLSASLPQPGGDALSATAVLQADLAGAATVPVIGKIVNAASLAEDGLVAPGSLFTIFGSTLANGNVSLSGLAAPVLMTSATQLNAQAPSNVAVNTQAQVTVRQGDAISMPQPVIIAAAAPAIFTQDGSGAGLGLIADAASGSLNSADAPAHSGDSVVIYCTGIGIPAQAVAVSIGGIVSDNVTARPSGDMPGAYEIVAVVPDGIEPGDAVAVKITVAGQTSPAVTMLLR